MIYRLSINDSERQALIYMVHQQIKHVSQLRDEAVSTGYQVQMVTRYEDNLKKLDTLMHKLDYC